MKTRVYFLVVIFSVSVFMLLGSCAKEEVPPINNELLLGVWKQTDALQNGKSILLEEDLQELGRGYIRFAKGGQHSSGRDADGSMDAWFVFRRSKDDPQADHVTYLSWYALMPGNIIQVDDSVNFRILEITEESFGLEVDLARSGEPAFWVQLTFVREK
jgi:hypothetical protein